MLGRGIKLIQYVCKECDNLSTKSSVCPVCGKRTSLVETAIFYCEKCNVPVFDETCPCCGSSCKKIGSDVRPVFAQERLLLEVLLGRDFEFAGKSVWSTLSNMYWIDGKKLKINLSELQKKDSKEIIDKLEQYKEKNQPYVDSDFSNEHIEKFIEANRHRLNEITEEATTYIQKASSNYEMSEMFVSFSGGKDSTAVSHLVMRALGSEKVIHIYGDTTLEYPTSSKYVKAFRERYPNTPLLLGMNSDQDFNNLCSVVGPPSRVLRWCCTVFKTGAITKKIEQVFRGKNRLLSFQGIRRSESLSRSKYERDSAESKIAKQVVSSPIIDWLDFDVWLYILGNKLLFNNAYRQGFSRVGCWCCPNNSKWSEFLSSIYMPDEYEDFRDVLYSFARQVGKEDWKEYIDSGNWKARQGGNGLKYSKNTVVKFSPCAFEEDAYNFDLSKPIDDTLYTLFKPFGLLNYEIGNKRLNEVYVLSRKDGKPLLKLSGRIGTNVLKVAVLDKSGAFKHQKIAEQLLNDQVTKYQTCIGCNYCQAVCKFDALKVINREKGNVSNNTIQYTIDESKCVGCLECVKHFDGGCYMKKVLRIKKER